jgi:mono/diheme cytochrome c family protein
LKSTPAKESYAPAAPADLANPAAPGAQAYLNHCASCHQLDGKGIANEIPALAGNGLVASGGPQSVIRVVVGGIEAQGTYGPMSAVGNGMTDQEVADATNYVRSAWSNNAPANVGPGEVATIRKETQTYLNGTLPGGCPALAQQDMAKIVADPAVQTLLQGTNPETMLQNVNQLIQKVKSAGPKIAQADIVNSLTIAYCPIVQKESALNAGQRLEQLNQFGERVYTQLTQNGKN